MVLELFCFLLYNESKGGGALKFSLGKLQRVDVQVSIFTAIIVIASFAFAFTFIYHIAYNDMINSLNERVFSIYNHVQQSLDISTFTEINVKEDQQKESYKTMKQLLESIRQATGVRYLYTAKQLEDGSFIYVVDGLDSSAPDFRYPGDSIEQDIYPDIQKATAGEIVLPDRIKKTDWGDIFITYFPVYYEEQVAGVLGIEFEAEHQYIAYRMIRIVTPVVALFACMISIIMAVIFFKHISNPLRMDLYNTDLLTEVKNINSYYVDIQNLSARKNIGNMGVIIADLNHLKAVNDELGHAMGDRYISSAAASMKQALSKKEIVYRTGGDEFTLLIPDASPQYCRELIGSIQKAFEKNKPEHLDLDLSIALGYAVFDPQTDNDILETCRRADKQMYQNKQRYYQQQQKESGPV